MSREDELRQEMENPENTCSHCGKFVAPESAFCMHCGTQNQHFDARLFVQEWGMPLLEFQRQECIMRHHEQKQLGIDPDLPYCQFCGFDLRKA